MADARRLWLVALLLAAALATSEAVSARRALRVSLRGARAEPAAAAAPSNVTEEAAANQATVAEERPAATSGGTDMPPASQGESDEVKDSVAAATDVPAEMTRPVVGVKGGQEAAAGSTSGEQLPPDLQSGASLDSAELDKETLGAESAAGSEGSAAASDEESVSDSTLQWLKPNYVSGVGLALDVDVPPGQSPVDAEKYRISSLRSRLAEVNGQLRRQREAIAKAEGEMDAAYQQMSADGDALHDAYAKHAEAARGVDLDSYKGDSATLDKLIAAAKKLVTSQEKHFTVAAELLDSLPLLYDHELALEITRTRIERAVAALETQLADSISRATSKGQEKVADPKPAPSS